MGTLYKFGFLDSFSHFDRMRDRRGRKIDYIQLIGSQSYAITISKDVNWRNFARYYLPPLDSTIVAQQNSLRDSPPTSFDNLRLQMKNIETTFSNKKGNRGTARICQPISLIENNNKKMGNGDEPATAWRSTTFPLIMKVERIGTTTKNQLVKNVGEGLPLGRGRDMPCPWWKSSQHTIRKIGKPDSLFIIIQMSRPYRTCWWSSPLAVSKVANINTCLICGGFRRVKGPYNQLSLASM